MRPSMHKITLVSLDVLEAYIQNAGLTGCEEQRDRLKREKDMHRALRALANAQMQGQAVQTVRRVVDEAIALAQQRNIYIYECLIIMMMMMMMMNA